MRGKEEKKSHVAVGGSSVGSSQHKDLAALGLVQGCASGPDQPDGSHGRAEVCVLVDEVHAIGVPVRRRQMESCHAATACAVHKPVTVAGRGQQPGALDRRQVQLPAAEAVHLGHLQLVPSRSDQITHRSIAICSVRLARTKAHNRSEHYAARKLHLKTSSV